MGLTCLLTLKGSKENCKFVARRCLNGKCTAVNKEQESGFCLTIIMVILS